MIKLFFSHVCDHKSHALANRISERIRKDIPQIESFIACRQEAEWNNAAELNSQIEESHFFIPIITDEFPSRKNCRKELDLARERKKVSANFPIIFPVRFQAQELTMQGLDFLIDQESGTGERWIDFSDSATWEIKHEELRQRIHTLALKYSILGDIDFYKDREHLDIIIKRDKPTANEIKFVVDVCKRQDEYASYFFSRLDKKEWIDHFKPYDFLKKNPQPEEDPKQTGFYKIPHWTALDYLEKVSKECGTPENHHYAEALLQVVRDLTKPLRIKKADNYRTWASFAKILSNLPTDIIEMNDIELVAEWFDSRFETSFFGIQIGRFLLPRLLKSEFENDWKKAAKLIEIVTRGVPKKQNNSVLESYWLREAFAINAQLLGERCGREVIEILNTRLSEILETETEDRYSYIWRQTIRKRGEENDSRIENVLVSAIRDILISFSKSKTREAHEAVRSLLRGKLFVSKRLALYVITEHFETHQEIFWQELNSDFFNAGLRSELSELFKKHFRGFSDQQQSRIIEIISSLTSDNSANLQQSWLRSLKGLGNAHSGQFNAVEGTEPEESFDDFQMEEEWHGRIPDEVEVFSSGNIAEISQHLKKFEASAEWSGSSEERLSDSLKEAVKENPNKFESNLPPFRESKLVYQQAILRAFEELWSAKKMIEWGQVLEFCRQIVSAEEFWLNSSEIEYGGSLSMREVVTSTICRLIEAGTRDDEWAFDETYLPLAAKLLFQIQEKVKPSAKGNENDALMEAMNTAKGYFIGALINYSLRQARLFEKRGEGRDKFWETIQPAFDRELEQSKDANFEFSALAGWYLPNLHYLSRGWVETNIDRIFSLEADVNWKCAIHGYTYVNTFRRELYGLLKSHGHLEKAITAEFKKELVHESLVKHVAIAYLLGLESLEDDKSLIARIFNDWQRDDIVKIVSFFWEQHFDGKLEGETIARVFSFWKLCYQRIVGHEEENAIILSELNLLSGFLEYITEDQKNWLLQSAPYVEESHHSMFFIEYLDKLTERHEKIVAEVYLKMLSKTKPLYPDANIRSIVEKIFKAGFNST